MIGNGDQLGPQTDQRQVEDEAEEIADPHRDDDTPEQGRLRRHDVRPRLDALDQHRADHQRHDAVRRDAQGQHRDERGLRRSVVGRFRGGNAFNRPFAEFLRMFGGFLGQRVRRESAQRRTAARQDAKQGTQARALQGEQENALQVRPGWHQALDFCRDGRLLALFFEVADDFCHAEHTDRHGDKLHAIQQVFEVQGKTGCARIHVGTDRTHQQADDHHANRLDNRPGSQHHRSHQAEHEQRGIFGRPELDRHCRKRRGKQGQDRGGNRPGKERGDGCCRQRQPGPPLPGHLVAVQTGDDRRGFSGNIDQDRGRRTTVLGTVVNPGQHDQRPRRIKRKGQWQEHGDGHHRPQTGQNADQRAEQGAGKTISQIQRRQRRGKSETQVAQYVHDQPLT